MNAKKKSASVAPVSKAAGLSITPAEIWRMFRERWVVGLLLGLCAAAAVVVLQMKEVPVYRTEASLLFETRKDRVLNIQDVVDTDVRSANELNTHIEQIRSQTFLDYVLSSFTPEEVKRIQDPYRDPEHPDAAPPSMAAIIQPNVNAYVRRGTMILGIAVTNRNPENAALIANRYARRYIEFNLDRANTGTNSALVFLRKQAEETREQLQAAEDSMQSYRTTHNIAVLGQTQNVVLQKVPSLGAAIVSAQMQEIELRSTMDKIAEFRDKGKDLLQIPQIKGFGQVSALAERLSELRAQRDVLEQTYLKAHPKMLANELSITETTQALGQGIDAAIADLQVRYNMAAEYEKRLTAELDDAQKKVHELDKISVDYQFLEQEAETKRATYAKIVDRLNDASVASQMENVNIKTFDPAFAPSEPSGSPALQTGVMAAGLFLGLLLLVPIGIGLLDGRVKTFAHVEHTLGETLLGAVKDIKGLGESERAHAFRMLKDQALSESYRGIYSEIGIRSDLPFPKAVLVTSTMPGDGKSFTISNLAAVFAAHGRRTLLVDCDLRRPALNRFFGIEDRAGWTQWILSGDVGSTNLPARVTIAENLDVLPAGGAAKNPTELLDRIAAVGLFKRLEEAYDLILVDTPPVGVFPDALLLSRQCNEAVYVCRFAQDRIGAVRKALKHLHESGITVLGMIMNKVPENRLQGHGYSGYGSYQSKYYRAYQKANALN
jgi:capsular exopolysaccharide synthesis family protein